MSQLLRVLQVEDSEGDAALILRVLSQAGYQLVSERVEDAQSMVSALSGHVWDVIISDYFVPGFGAGAALGVLSASGQDVPFIIVSGTIGEEVAVAMMRSGAHDYLMKDNLKRLPPAVEREVREARIRAARRETERQLEESRERLETIANETPLGTFDYCPPAGKFVCSQHLKTHLGLPPDTEPNCGIFLGALHPDNRIAVVRTFRRALRGDGGGRFALEHRLASPEGDRERWLSSWGRVFFDEEGRAVRLLGAARDISERKNAEKGLRYQLLLTERITRQTSDAIFVVDSRGIVRFANPGAEQIFGFTSAELMGRVLHDTIHYHYPDGRPFPRTECAMLQPLDGQAVRDSENVFFCKDGSRITASISRASIQLEGGETGRVITIRDITERKRGEQALRDSDARFRALTEADLVGIIIADNREIFEANDHFISMLGYTREEFLARRFTYREITSPASLDISERAILRCMQTGSTGTFEKEYVRRDGSTVPAMVGGVRISHNGRPCIFGFIIDLTERRSLEEQFRQAQKLDTVGQLAGGIAHDFNNLLTVILGYSGMLVAELDGSSPLLEAVGEIARAASRAAALTGQLLTFSRQQPTRPKVVRVNDLLVDLQKMLRRLIGENIEITLALDPDSGSVRIDPVQLEQVVVNLAVNARDAMPSGGLICIETAPLSVQHDFAGALHSLPHGNYLQLIVSDTGVGMSPEIQSRIFEPFFTTKEQGKGTGLGLSTVYGIVKQCGGSINVHSSPDLGTTFRVIFPAVPGATTPETVGADTIARRGSETVLVVEDEPGVRRYVREILIRGGYRVLEAGDAAGALGAALEYADSLDILLTDFILPGQTGYEIARQVRALIPGLPVLIMSGYSERLGHGNTDAEKIPRIQKPFKPGDLTARLRSILDADAGSGTPDGDAVQR